MRPILDVTRLRRTSTTVPGDAKVGPEQSRLMMRALLAERFNLRMHTETRQLPVFALTQAQKTRLGPGLRPTTRDCDAMREALWKNSDVVGARDAYESHCADYSIPKPGFLTLRYAGSIAQLILAAGGVLDRPLIDATRPGVRRPARAQAGAANGTVRRAGDRFVSMPPSN